MDDTGMNATGERYPEELPRVFLRRWCVEQAIRNAPTGDADILVAAQKIYDWVTAK